jgi:hypothetical protein
MATQSVGSQSCLYFKRDCVGVFVSAKISKTYEKRQTMPQLIPTELEDGTIIYFQVEESPVTPFGTTRSSAIADNAQAAAQAKAIQSFQAMQNLVRGYTVNTLNAFRNLSTIEVSEVTLEFGVSLDAKAGVPFIASGGASSNLKITVKCAFPKKSA